MHSELLIILVVATALAFDFTNGFHDTANVVATSISTRALSPRVAVALQPIALVLKAVDLDQVGSELGAGSQAAQRLGDLLAGAHEHPRKLDGLLHRRLDAVQAELRRRLLGVVDDVVERGRQGITVARVEGGPHPPASGEPVDDVVGDAIAFALAHLQILRQRGALGVLHEQVMEQQAASLYVAAGLLDERHEGAVDATPQEAHRARILRRRRSRPAFTIISRLDYEIATQRAGGACEAANHGRRSRQ